MIGRKSKVQPDIIGIDNDSLIKVLDSLSYTKGVRQGVAFESANLGQVNSMILMWLLQNKQFNFGDNFYKISLDSIERTRPDLKPDPKPRWSILKRN